MKDVPTCLDHVTYVRFDIGESESNVLLLVGVSGNDILGLGM
jgi:hypothetical protein